MPGTHSLDSIIVGYYRGEELIYVARVRNGFVPASRRQVFEPHEAGTSNQSGAYIAARWRGGSM